MQFKLRHHKQRFEKIATAVVLDKDENLLWSELSCDDIGVVIAKKWRHYLFYLQQYFPPIPASMFLKFKRNL